MIAADRKSGAVSAASHGLAHQFICAGAMLGGHAASAYSELAMQVVMHPATNVTMMGMAAWCWLKGDQSWRRRRNDLASVFEKAAMRSTIAAAGLGMMVMHVPVGGHHHHAAAEHASKALAGKSWFDVQSPGQREKIIAQARTLNMPLDKYLENICGTGIYQPELRKE